MVRPIVRDVFFLGQKSEPAAQGDLQIGKDLQDTLKANQDHCGGRSAPFGMAANMIGIKKRVIVVNMGFVNVVMYNPVILRREKPYEAEEGCLSLDGTLKTTRYEAIELEYRDEDWRKHRQPYTGWIAQIIQHEVDHLDGIII
ncbi:MAG: peptide deformylase [bacterium]